MEGRPISVEHRVVPTVVPSSRVDEPPSGLELGGYPNMSVGKDDRVNVRAGPEKVESKSLLCLSGGVQIGGGSSLSGEAGR